MRPVTDLELGIGEGAKKYFVLAIYNIYMGIYKILPSLSRTFFNLIFVETLLTYTSIPSFFFVSSKT